MVPTMRSMKVVVLQINPTQKSGITLTIGKRDLEMGLKDSFILPICGNGLKHQPPSIILLEKMFLLKMHVSPLQTNNLHNVMLVINIWDHHNVILVVLQILMQMNLTIVMRKTVLMIFVQCVTRVHLW